MGGLDKVVVVMLGQGFFGVNQHKQTPNQRKRTLKSEPRIVKRAAMSPDAMLPGKVHFIEGGVNSGPYSGAIDRPLYSTYTVTTTPLFNHPYIFDSRTLLFSLNLDPKDCLRSKDSLIGSINGMRVPRENTLQVVPLPFMNFLLAHIAWDGSANELVCRLGLKAMGINVTAERKSNTLKIAFKGEISNAVLPHSHKNIFSSKTTKVDDLLEPHLYILLIKTKQIPHITHDCANIATTNTCESESDDAGNHKKPECQRPRLVPYRSDSCVFSFTKAQSQMNEKYDGCDVMASLYIGKYYGGAYPAKANVYSTNNTLRKGVTVNLENGNTWMYA